MPGPVPGYIAGFNGGGLNTAKARPECMARVAAIAVAWTVIEGHLTLVANCSLGTAQTHGETGVGMSGNWVAQVAMQQAETIRMRIKMVDALVAPLLTGTDLKERWDSLRSDLMKRSRQRNRIIHGRWVYAEELPAELVLLSDTAPERWTIADFEDVLQSFFKLEQELLGFAHEIGIALAAGTLAKHPLAG